MVRIGFALTAAAAVFFASGAEVSAQSGRGGWWSPVVTQQSSGNTGSILRDAVLGRAPGQDTQGRQEARLPGGRVANGNGNGKNGNGPPFCRNGRGHPVHGRAWCEQKGWVGQSGWAREGWGDVIFGGRAPSQEREVGQTTIGGILGDVILGRVTRFGRDAGLGGAVDGRWVPLSSGGSVLQLRMGGVPIAEMADLNRDGRAEVVLLNYVH